MDRKTLKKTLAHIREQFDAGATFLKKQRIEKSGGQIKLQHANWFLVMGTQGAGKTSLLKNAELNYVFSRKSTEKEKAYENHWWVTKDSVFLDIPSSYLGSKNNKIWRYFLKCVRRHSFQKKLDGILVVLKLNELEDSKHHSALIKTLKKRLHVIRNTFKQRIPVFFIINQCDKLEGFNAFFAEPQKDERQQTWGIHLNPEKSLAKQLKHEFRDLKQKLNNQLIYRAENTNENLNEMRHFLEAFSHLSPSIQHFGETLKTHIQKHYSVEGLYFTAAFCPTRNKNITIANKFSFQNTTGEAFFIHDLLLSISKTVSQARKKHNVNRVGFTIFGCITAVIAILLLLAFKVGNQEKTLALANEQLNASNESLMQKLANTNNTLKNNALQLAGSNSGETQIHSTYIAMLVADLYPKLNQAIVTILQSTDATDAMRYAALDLAIRLQHNNPLPLKTFQNDLSVIGLQAPGADETLIQKLQMATNQAPSNTLDTEITNTQSYFSNLNPGKLMIAILETQPEYSQALNINFSHNDLTKNVFSYQNTSVSIPALYTAKAKQNINEQRLVPLIKIVHDGNLALGAYNNTASDKVIYDTFEQAYNSAYNRTWQNFINNITIVKTDSLSGIKTQLNQLQAKNSALSALLAIINNNMPALKEYTKRTQYQSFMTKLTQYAKTLSTISTPKDAFDFTRNRFFNTRQNDQLSTLLDDTRSMPQPLQRWLYTAIMQSWQVLMQTTGHYIQNEWQTKLASFYQAQFSNHYPFDTQADSEASLDAFNAFFGDNGLYENFLHNTLEPFISTSERPWRIKHRNDASLNLNNDALKTLMQLQTINTLYFKHHSDTASFNFKIQPTTHDSTLEKISLALGRQVTLFTPNNASKKQSLHWPDDDNQNFANISIATNNGKNYRFQEGGTWAMLKLFAAGKVQFDNTQKAWILSYSQKNSPLLIELAFSFNPADKNPFDLNLFSNIQLPQTLINNDQKLQPI